MKILLDENIPKRLRFRIQGRPGITEVRTIKEMGWNGKTNGELLSLLTENEFEVLITLDKGLYKQQNLTKFSITIILLRVKTNKYEDIQPLLTKLYTSLSERPEGTLIVIES